MMETFCRCEVKAFSPLIVSINIHRRNLFEENKIIFNECKEEICEAV